MRDLPADRASVVPALPGADRPVLRLRQGQAGRLGHAGGTGLPGLHHPRLSRLPGLRGQPAAGPVRQLPAGTAAAGTAGRPEAASAPARAAEGSARGDRPAGDPLRWLAKPPVAAVLSGIAAESRDLSHGELDRLEQTPVLAHLRSVLVATGMLPPRDEQMARLERFTSEIIDGRPDPEQRQVLRRYATWHLLRRSAAGTTASPSPASSTTSCSSRSAAPSPCSTGWAPGT